MYFDVDEVLGLEFCWNQLGIPNKTDVYIGNMSYDCNRRFFQYFFDIVDMVLCYFESNYLFEYYSLSGHHIVRMLALYAISYDGMNMLLSYTWRTLLCSEETNSYRAVDLSRIPGAHIEQNPRFASKL